MLSRRTQILITAGAVGLTALLTIVATANSRAHHDLEKYKAELRARGEILTFQELQAARPPGIPASPVRFASAVGPLRAARSQPGNLKFRTYVGPARARLIWKGPGLFDWEGFRLELGGLSNSLADLRQVLQDPPLDWGPRPNAFSRTGPDFVAIRTAAQWLSGAAMEELREGRLAAALEDLEALAGLARMNQSEFTLVAQMIRISVCELGTTATWEALAARGWTDPQLERLQRAWEALDLQDAVERGLVAERVGGGELWRMMRQPDGPLKVGALMTPSSGGPQNAQDAIEKFFSDRVIVPTYKMISLDEDELFFLHLMQAILDSLRRLRTQQPWKTVFLHIDQQLLLMSKAWGSPTSSFRYWLSMAAVPNVLKATQSAVHAETERRLTTTAIALQRFQLRHGSAPPNLEALVPELLTVVPVDPMSGRPFCYKVDAADGFLLYSTGEDSQDNGGDGTSTPASPTGRGFGMWEGRDAVWPVAAGP